MTPRRVGQSAPYVVVVGDVLQSAHKTIGQRVTIDKSGRCLPCQ